MSKKMIIILFILILAIILIANFAKRKNKYQHYLVLGDSIAEGYALPSKSDRYSKIVQEHYHIKTENVTDLSQSGMTAQELAKLIKTKEYREAIQKSDLITISIGSNELLGVLTSLVQEAFLLNSSSNQNLETLTNALIVKLQQTETKALLENRVALYEQSWQEIIQTMKQYHANATIVATEFYNPLYEVKELGKIAKNYIERMNQILKEKSQNETLYSIAKIYENFNSTNAKLTNMNLNSSSFSLAFLDPHPNKQGHQLIAQKIIQAEKKQ